jgi:hypothetical protein
MNNDSHDSTHDPAVQPIGASCGGRSSPSCLPGNPACTTTAPMCNALGMHLQLVSDPSPPWIIGEDANSGEAWLVHNRHPRFVASIHQQNTVAGDEDSVLLDCGLALTQLRWLGTPGRTGYSHDLMTHANRVLAQWMHRQLSRAGRAA